MTATRTVEDYDVLEPDWYDATLDKIEESEKDGPYGPYLTWHFTAATGDDIEARSADSWKGDTKARRWYSAVLGRPLAKGEEIDLASVLGRPCRINLTTVQSDKGVTYNRVTDVAPTRSQSAAPTTAVPTARQSPTTPDLGLPLDDLPF